MTFKKVLQGFNGQLERVKRSKWKSGTLEQKTLTKIDRFQKQLIKTIDSLPDEDPQPQPKPIIQRPKLKPDDQRPIYETVGEDYFGNY